MTELTPSDFLEALLAFYKSTKDANELYTKVGINTVYWDLSQFLIWFSEAMIKYICNIDSKVKIAIYETAEVGTVKGGTYEFNFTDWEQTITQIYQDGINYKLRNKYKIGVEEYTLYEIALLSGYVLACMYENNKFEETYSVKLSSKLKKASGTIATETGIITLKNLITSITKPTNLQPSLSEILDQVGKLIKNYVYIRHRYSTAAALRKYGNSDCWGMAAFLCQELTKRGVKARRRQGRTSGSNAHRWAEYWNGSKWIPFPTQNYNRYVDWRYFKSATGVHTLSGCGT